MDEEHRGILLARRNAFLATLNADGSPQLTPVWVDVDGDEVLVNSLAGSGPHLDSRSSNSTFAKREGLKGT